MPRYDAFISYSRRDKAFAARLEQRLEKYKAPYDLQVRQGYLNIFRDQKDFTGADYFESLQQHLQDSETLIVLCSPHARASEYVNDEIRRFVALKGAERIIPILVSGLPNNEATPEREADKAFPEALSEALPMPLAANYLDFDVTSDQVDRGAYLDAWFTVLANVYRVSRSEIEQRERKRRARFVRTAVAVTASVVAMLVIALVVTLLSRAEAVRQAIEARSETSTRLAVQALEKIRGEPETALRLAINAVDTYHRHGDPPVSRALEALLRTRLSFGGGRPVMPAQPEGAELVFSEDLTWAAAATDSGEVLFTRAGSGEVVKLQPPSLLKASEAWSDEAPVLLFTPDRLIAGLGIVSEGKRQPRNAAYWYWALSKQGITGEAAVIARFPIRLWNRLEPIASPGGRWISWYGEGDTLFLKDLDSGADALQIKSDYDQRAMRAFSSDETQMLAFTQSGLVVLALEGSESVDAETMPAEVHRLAESRWNLRSTMAHHAYSISERGCRREELPPGLFRVATVETNGDAAWWDLSADEPQRRTLPNIFTAFTEQMRVWRLEKRQVTASLEFSPCGESLLVTVAEKKGEFGIAAHIDLGEGEAWKPIIVEQLKGQLHASMSRTSGTGFGVSGGYELKDRKKLGVAHATWFTRDGLLTIGFDGSLEFHDLERGASQYLSGGITAVDEADYIHPEGGISAGTRDGELKIFGKESSDPVFVLSGHDAPVKKVFQAPRGRRVVTIASSGQARTWDMKNPVLRPDHFRGVADDWRSFRYGETRARVWNFSAEEPFLRVREEQAQPPATQYAETKDGDWAIERIAQSDDVAASMLHLIRRGAEGIGDDVAASRLLKLPFPAKPEPYWHRWRWDKKGYLRVTDTQAFLLVTGSHGKGAGAFLIDLLNPKSQPIELLDPADGYAISAVSENMSHMLIKRYAKDSRRVEVRGVLQRRGETILGIGGQRDGKLSEDGRWLATEKDVYDLRSPTPVLRTQRDFPHGWGRRGVVFKVGRPPLWLDESGDLWGLDHAVGDRSPPRRLSSGLELGVVAWSEDGVWLGLGGKHGEVRVATLGREADFAEIAEGLGRVAEASALPVTGTDAANERVMRILMSPDAGWLAAKLGRRRYTLWHRSPGGMWQQPIVLERDVWKKGEELFVDSRWLIGKDGLYDFSQSGLVRRASREANYTWRYSRLVFSAGRPPLWLDESGNLWGLDHADGAAELPQLLVSGLDLETVSWSDDGKRLGLGGKNGDVRITAITDGAGFAEIGKVLARAANQPALPAPWDERARDSIRSIKMSSQGGWVSARAVKGYYLLWRAAPEGGWRDPIVLHQSDRLLGYKGLQCRSDGQWCFLQGQLLIFDESQLISVAGALLQSD